MTTGQNATRTSRGGLEARQLPGYALYAMTLGGQLIGAFARALVVEIALEILGIFVSFPIPAEPIAVFAGLAPLVVSLLCVLCPWLVCPIAGRWWEMSIGGRAPEQDEREAFDRAIAILQMEDRELKPPRHWFVDEDRELNASVFASSVRLTRGLLESPEAAPAFISHEYKHLRSGDGRLMCALEMLLLWPVETPEIRPLRSLPLRGLVWVGSGQAVMWLLANSWETYWRSREYAADEYTISVGQGPAFARSLRSHSLPYERPVRWMAFSLASHPYSKQRIARLEGRPEETAGAGR